ncbi:hypothetical protein [Elioraea sp.]|uniref:hypothetical protein n=1 Tax=Elioraea sp. TaxID=2185103 RepID=UPI0025BC1968|nr:hypothetical protein [Elioraea sp.]
MRALAILVAALAALPASGRDLGTMPFSGAMAIEWIAIEPGADGVVTGRYRLRGGIDGDGALGGEEALLSGFDIRCVGVMQFGQGFLLSDEASCRVTDRFGEGLWLDIRSGADTWGWHRLTLTFADGTGPYARVRGEGQVTRAMHTDPASRTPWGMFHGEVRWRLD